MMDKSSHSRSSMGGFDGNPQTIVMPAYREMATVTKIPPAYSTETKVEYVRTNGPVDSQKDEQPKHSEANDMSISREELDAKLAQNKAEVGAVATEMRREMSEWRTQQTEIMMKLQSEVSAINVKLDERFEAQKRSSSLIQWLVSIILAFVALIPVFQSMFDNSRKNDTNAPIVIQVPQQQAQVPLSPQAKQ